MPESNSHLLLKKHGKLILKNEGFKGREIFNEYKIRLQGNKYYLIDVVGINLKKKVLIECGTLNGENRLKIMKQFCDKIIHLPYLKISNKIIKPRKKPSINEIIQSINKELKFEQKNERIRKQPLPT